MRRRKGRTGVARLHEIMDRYGDQVNPTKTSLAGSWPEVEMMPDLAFGVTSDFDTGCDTCQGLGYVKYDHEITHPDFGKLEPCPECRGNVRVEQLIKLSRLSGELLEYRLDGFDPRNELARVVPQVKVWIRADAGWLTLSGPHGTGKTFLLAALANLYIERGIPALYTTVADLLADLQATFNPASEQVYSKLFANVMDVKVLLLDEAEKWHGTPWAQTQVFRLLEHRDRNGSELRTVLATNTDLRPLVVRPGSVDLYKDPLFPNYLESRILSGSLVTDFWRETDIRPAMGTARRADMEKRITQYEQGGLI